MGILFVELIKDSLLEVRALERVLDVDMVGLEAARGNLLALLGLVLHGLPHESLHLSRLHVLLF